jgi:four helix bundle protein
LEIIAVQSIRIPDYQMENSDIREPDRKPEWKNIKPSHEKLWIWQKANKLYLEICSICKTLPRNEMYSLRAQIERSSKSVKDNIAEANESYYYEEKRRGLFIARKEAAETQNHIRELEDKKYIENNKSQDMIDEYEGIKRGINGLVKSIAEKKDINKRKGAKRI